MSGADPLGIHWKSGPSLLSISPTEDFLFLLRLKFLWRRRRKAAFFSIARRGRKTAETDRQAGSRTVRRTTVCGRARMWITNHTLRESIVRQSVARLRNAKRSKPHGWARKEGEEREEGEGIRRPHKKEGPSEEVKEGRRG